MPSREQERARVVEVLLRAEYAEKGEDASILALGDPETLRLWQARAAKIGRALASLHAAGFAVVPREARVSMCLVGKRAFDEATALLDINEGASMAMRSTWEAMVERTDLARPPAADGAPVPASEERT